MSGKLELLVTSTFRAGVSENMFTIYGFNVFLKDNSVYSLGRF